MCTFGLVSRLRDRAPFEAKELLCEQYAAYEKIRPRLVGKGPEFAPEMMIEVLRMRRRVVEVPISYYARIGGDSKHSASFLQLARTALKMLRLILRKRFFPG